MLSKPGALEAIELSDWDSLTNDPVVSRYVGALYEVSVDMKREPQFLDQMKTIYEVTREMNNAEKVLKKFSLLPEGESTFIDCLSEKLSLLPEIENFLRVVFKNKRFPKFLDICEAYISFVDRKRHDKKFFYVTYAKDFSDNDKSSLVRELQELFGGEIECLTKKDESLIDGLQIQYRSKVLDYSVKSKLSRLSRAIRGDRYED